MKNPLEIIKEEQEHLARMKEILNTSAPDMEDAEYDEKEICPWFYGKVVYPFMSLTQYLGSYYFVVPSKDDLEKLSFPTLTSDEIFDTISSMPSNKLREVVSLMKCSPKVFDSLIEATKQKNKDSFISALYSENIDTFYISQFCSLYNITNESNEVIDYVKSSMYSDQEESIETAKSVVEYYDPKFEGARVALDVNNDFDFSDIYNNYNQAIGVESKHKEVFRVFWRTLLNICGSHEKELMVIDEFIQQYPLLAKWDEEFSAELMDASEEDGTCPSDLRLPHPNSIFRDDLNYISEVYPCLLNQNLAYFFGYGEWDKPSEPKIIWHGKWGELACFLRVLYVGSINNGKIDYTGHDMDDGLWAKARKIFINEKGKTAAPSTFPNADCENFIANVSKVMLKVLKNAGR